MFSSSFKAGFTALRRRPGLPLLLYVLNLIPALILAIPIYSALAAHLGPTGFGAEMMRGFDLVLWADLLEEMGAVLGALWAQLLWMIPVYFLWKAALSVGLIHALRGSSVRSFWAGAGRFTGRAVVLSLLFLLPLLVWLSFTAAAAALLSALWPGEVGTFWTYVVITPLLLAAGLALIDLMQDYARIALVVEEHGIIPAWKAGLHWPVRHPAAVALYAAWLLSAALLLTAPTLLEMRFPAAALGTVWALFLLQQVFLLLRAAVTAAWIGSETAFFESVRRREMPLIAGGEEEGEAAPEVAGSIALT